MNPEGDAPIDCELLSHDESNQIQPIYTGFAMLHRAGAVRLSQKLTKRPPVIDTAPEHLRYARATHLTVRVDGRVLVYYDSHDSFEVEPSALDRVDHYFKRSYSRERLRGNPGSEKVHPLGLIYPVYSDGFDRFALQRATLWRGLGLIKAGVRAIGLDRLLAGRMHTPRLRDLEGYPALRRAPRVLFLAKVFDPQTFSLYQREPIERLNSMRADCVRLLRKELGSAFLGGLAHNSYSTRKFKDCLLPDPDLSLPRNYLRVLRQFPIGVATKGLHESNGFKLAEYVSASMAIVSESLQYAVPGFRPGTNYLDFNTPRECADAAVRLIEEPNTRWQLMLNNFHYYRTHLRPDAVVLSTLKVALGSSDPRPE